MVPLKNSAKYLKKNSQGALVVNNLPANAGDLGAEGLTRVRKIPWRRKWQPTPLFLSGKFHGQRSSMKL